MIKKLLFIGMITITSQKWYSQSFNLIYLFTNVTTGTGTLDPTPTPTVTGVTSGSWTSVGTGSASSGGGYFSFTQWGTGATNGNNSTFTGSLDPGKYYELNLTPQSNYMITLNSMTFGSARSGTGVRNWAVRTGQDGFNANIPATYTALGSAATASSAPLVTIQNGDTFFWSDDAFSTSVIAGAAFNNICEATFPAASHSNIISGISIRVYAWNAEGAGGTFRLDTVNLKGIATFSLGTGFNKVSHDLNAKIKLYPNPSAKGFAFIESAKLTNAKIEILNILGKVVSTKINTNGTEKVQLDLANLPAGNYFVRMITSEGVYSEKLIITE